MKLSEGFTRSTVILAFALLGFSAVCRADALTTGGELCSHNNHDQEHGRVRNQAGAIMNAAEQGSRLHVSCPLITVYPYDTYNVYSTFKNYGSSAQKIKCFLHEISPQGDVLRTLIKRRVVNGGETAFLDWLDMVLVEPLNKLNLRCALPPMTGLLEISTEH